MAKLEFVRGNDGKFVPPSMTAERMSHILDEHPDQSVINGPEIDENEDIINRLLCDLNDGNNLVTKKQILWTL